jgi:hypothetical protein
VRPTLSLFVLLAAAATCGLDAAPVALPPSGSVPLQPAPGAPEEVSPLGELLLLDDPRVSVRYPPDSLDRATRVQARLQALVELWKPFTPRPLAWSAVIVHRDAWERAGFGGWGAPRRMGAGTFVVPAAGDAGTVAFARALLGGGLPQLPGDPLMGTRDEAASLMVCDLLLQLEAARELAASAPLAGDAPWVTGVLMHLAARYAWERAEPGQTLTYVGIFDAVAAAHGGARAYRLADFTSGLPFERDLWFQAQFVRGADAIWVEEGWTGTARRLYRWGSKGKPVEAADLEKKYPRLVEWQTTAFAP